MNAYELIKRKRDGGTLGSDDIRSFMAEYTSGAVADYQMSALLMAIYFRGLDARELGAWTGAMLHSGRVLDLSDIPGKKVDKHSTGGVGDKVSLPLAALAAACGVKVPMISGRGLGHTGGTLDKLESIPGFRVDLTVEAYREQVARVGACLIGQTAELAPADRKLYALRDVTATVDCLPLIASSIMSKKLAEGIDGLVLDVKVGSGAFMKDLEQARLLARTMIGIGKEMGKQVTAYLTDMSQPLGNAVGNALEVAESIAVLRGRGPADLVEITVALGAEMLLLADLEPDQVCGRARIQAAIADGSGEKKWREIVQAQGGSLPAVVDPSTLPRAQSVAPLPATRRGFITGIQCEEVGLAAVELGAGRSKVTDPIDPAVGMIFLKKIGDPVEVGEPMVEIHHNQARAPAPVLERLAGAIAIGAEPAARPTLVIERVE